MDFKPLTYLATGLPCAGKTTIMQEIHKYLLNSCGEDKVVWHDGDRFRKCLEKHRINLGFSDKDRKKNLEYLANYSLQENKNRKIVLASFVSPTEEARGVLKNIKQ